MRKKERKSVCKTKKVCVSTTVCNRETDKQTENVFWCVLVLYLRKKAIEKKCVCRSVSVNERECVCTIV